jgi:hypothetical protein
MTDDGRVLGLLAEVLDEFPTTAPDRLLASVLEGLRTAQQRGRQPSLGGLRDVFARPLTPRRAAGSMVIVAAVVVAAVAFVQLGGRLGISGPGGPGTPSPSVSASPSASPPQSAFDGTLQPIEDIGDAGLRSGVAYTSRLFQPPVAFKLLASGLEELSGPPTDFCPPITSPRTIVLAWLAGCVSDLRFIRPFAVECGTTDTHPDAATLAAAILAKPNMGGVRDFGPIQGSSMFPASLFRGNPSGRVVDVFGGRFLARNATDPDHCRLLPEPGSQDPVIEIRGDLTARLILLDVDDQLVVLRVAGGGYDARTGAAARDRGYGAGGDLFNAILTGIHDIEFK